MDDIALSEAGEGTQAVCVGCILGSEGEEVRWGGTIGLRQEFRLLRRAFLEIS